MTVDADIPSTLDLLGKVVTDLQEEVVVGKDAITGTLKKVTDYTGFSGDVSEQSGNYLVIHCAVPGVSDATITAEVVGGTSGPVTLDEDGILIARIASNTQKIQVKAIKEGCDTVTLTYSLADLELAS